MSLHLLLLAVFCIAVSGAPGLLLSRRSAFGQWIAALLNLAGAAVGGAGLAVHWVVDSTPSAMTWAWSLPVGRLAVGLDGLSALFLIPMLLISALGSIYGLRYWPQPEHPGNGRKLRLCWGLMTAGMMLVALARDGVLFLMAWEVMALAAFFLVSTEDKKAEVRRAGWIYLIAAHVGTLCLFGLFALLRFSTGAFDLWPVATTAVPSGVAAAAFVLGVAGFGLKAGIMPLHVWLPGAHANAPSHVSAILSGVLLKTGVYGLMRVTAFLPQPPVWWGGTLLLVGTVSAVAGIAFAVSQQDFKRLLAYSSIENVGIIVMGLGLALLGRSAGRPDWVLLGMSGALLHVLNHSLFKPLLFMAAGSLLHAAHTRRIDQLGGLAKRMPRTFALFALGAVAICGLPPLNGFGSELLIYLGLFRTALAGGRTAAWAALAAPGLALVGALAVGGFVKLLGAVFAGTPRTRHGEHAHDPGAIMLTPMVLLAAGCVAVGIAPGALTGVVEHAVVAWDPHVSHNGLSLVELVSLHWITVAGLVLAGAVLTCAVVGRRWGRRRRPAWAGTWDCGYARSTSSMQYSGSSFAQMLTEFFGWMLWPRRHLPKLSGLFPRRTRFASEVPDTVLDRGLVPAFSLVERVFSWARPIQRGPVQVYLVYMLAVLFILLLFARG